MNSIHSYSKSNKKIWLSYKNLKHKESLDVLDKQYINVYDKECNEFISKYFLITSSYLLYKKDKKIKGYIDLNFIGYNFCLIKKSITLFNEDKFFTLFFDKINILNKWAKIIKKKCIFNDINKDYKAIKKLGKGAYSEVFLCKKIKNDKEYAVKIINKEYYINKLSERGYKSLINEISVLRNLDHKNILKISKIYESKKNFYIVTEYCNYFTLNELINNKKIFFKLKINLIKQWIDAMQYWSDKNIVHRDLKPENIFINKSSSNKLTLKVGDFGLSNSLDDDFIFYKCGTPGYISPEIINYKIGSIYKISLKVDIYSLGHIIYNILTTMSIFDFIDYEELIYKNKNNFYDIDIDTEYNVDLEFVKIIKLCLEDKPENRIDISKLKSLVINKFN